MNTGKKFETLFQKCCKKQKIFCLKLKDKTSYIRSDADAPTSKNICDFIIHYKGTMIALELKTCEGTNISFNQPPYEPTEKGVRIAPHQVLGLMEVNSYNIMAGFVLNFKERHTARTSRGECTFYIPIDKFLLYCKENPTLNSIGVDACAKYGKIIHSKKLRVNHEYFISDMLDELLG